MALYPKTFIDDLRLQADIVQVVQDYVSLKRVGNAYKGLCPFHGEKTPSFNVNRDRGFFHCFGCQASGDVFKFVELQEKVSFPDAVRTVAQKFGVPLPEPTGGPQEREADLEREGLLKIHEVATAHFREVLSGPSGRRARQILIERGLSAGTIDRLQLGFALTGRETLTTHLQKQGFPLPLLYKSGLVVERDDRPVDRFRNRLMIPITREGGSIVAFGGRAVEAEQQPKYLNSPETPVYSKSRTLYGLSLTKGDIRRLGYAVLVEGYFDFAQVLQGGVGAVVATCGTALTPSQVQLLRRFTDRVILSFDPDAAGQNAAARSCELLVHDGFQVRVAVLPKGEDPDVFVRQHGGTAYQDQLRGSRPYLEYLLDRSAANFDLTKSDTRLAFLNSMLAVAAGIPQAAARDQFADRLAHRAGVNEEVVRQEIRKAAVARKPELPARVLAPAGELTDAERDLLAWLLSEPAVALEALAQLDLKDLAGLRVRHILEHAVGLVAQAPEAVPSLLLERLSEAEIALVTGIAARTMKPAPAADCVRALRLRRFERERSDVQRQIDRLQEQGGTAETGEIDRLWALKRTLSTQIEALY